MIKISKVLSANDTAETGTHQAGMLIPKDPRILGFFPELDNTKKNPRVHISFKDDSGSFWEFAFIYYNNKYFGGTRNEFRLTRMTGYIRENNLVKDDEVILQNNNGEHTVSYRRKNGVKPCSNVLVLGSGWNVINL
tara:strand:+ start:20141 stop:20548 length:408 start_codon:yes stop_codon:yes gene_type:complete